MIPNLEVKRTCKDSKAGIARTRGIQSIRLAAQDVTGRVATQRRRAELGQQLRLMNASDIWRSPKSLKS